MITPGKKKVVEQYVIWGEKKEKEAFLNEKNCTSTWKKTEFMHDKLQIISVGRLYWQTTDSCWFIFCKGHKEKIYWKQVEQNKNISYKKSAR